MTFKEWLNNPSLDQNLSIGCLGQSGYVLKKNETTILIDPYLTDYVSHPDGLNDPKMKRQFPPVISPSEIQTVDAILCTHAHGDHMDPWTLERIKPRYKLYCTEAAFNNNPVNLDADQLIWVDWEKPIAINEFSITAIPAAHYNQSDPEGKPDCVSFIISVDNINLFYWGDGIPYEGLIERLSQNQYDLFFAPINGRDWFREKNGIIGNLNSRELAKICSELKIATVIPNHFDLFEYNSEIPAHFINYVDQINPNQKVKILNHKNIMTI
jgi:L-ascorbate metabolism protein UlaG (beta-lactamase superfamily)